MTQHRLYRCALFILFPLQSIIGRPPGTLRRLGDDHWSWDERIAPRDPVVLSQLNQWMAIFSIDSLVLRRVWWKNKLHAKVWIDTYLHQTKTDHILLQRSVTQYPIQQTWIAQSCKSALKFVQTRVCGRCRCGSAWYPALDLNRLNQLSFCYMFFMRSTIQTRQKPAEFLASIRQIC